MVGLTHQEPAPPPPRVKFVEEALPSEPKSDRKLRTAGGIALRERMVRSRTPNGISIRLTLVKLDAQDRVVGAPDVAPAHEIVIDATGSNAMTAEGVAAAIEEAREVAAAQAELHFNGLDMLDNILPDRLN